MRHPANDQPKIPPEVLADLDQANFNVEEAVDRLTAVRADAAASRFLDAHLLDRLQRQRKGLLAAKEIHEQLEGVINKLTAPPFFPATLVKLETFPDGLRALVRQGANERIVGFGDGVESAGFRPGDLVYLAHEQNVIVSRAPGEPNCTGETCSFERRTADGRLVVKSRDEEFVVQALPALAGLDLKPGALLRWDRNTLFASEKIERSNSSQHFLEETPRENFESIGGLGPQISRITDSLQLRLRHPEIARQYRLPPKGSILLHGPAGTGKTLIAKALANWMARIAPSGRSYFMNIKPASLNSVWFSQSEANYREIFRIARETAAANPGSIVLIFFDEIDSIGCVRGGSQMRVSDSVLTSFLAEIDGVAERGDVLVVGATNRRDALDPALLRGGRFGDMVIEIPRPDRKASRDIFSKHLPADLPYARNGHGDDLTSTRAEILDAAVSTIFSPNSNNELAVLTFRDGKSRSIHAASLVTGAMIANISRTASERACLRQVETGEAGLTWPDVAHAIEQEFSTAAGVLTPANCRHHLSGLPQDLDVVKVELAVRKVPNPQRYLNAA